MRSHAWVFGAGLTALAALADVLTHDWPDFIVLVIAGPWLGAAVGTLLETIGLSLLALGLAAAAEWAHGPVVAPNEMLARLAAIGLGSLAAVAAARMRERGEWRLREAVRLANAAALAKGQFVATMSHEMRTPLNALVGMTGVLLDTRLEREQRECVEIIRHSSHALLALINDLLDFSKIEAGAVALAEVPFDPRRCLEDTLDLVASRAADKGLDLGLLADPLLPRALVGDPARLRQVLVNLVDNAVKFTERGFVLVEARLRRAAEGPGALQELWVSISDTGPGIPSEAQARLFQPFQQLDAATAQRYGGTGLGLAICKRLCEAMGGSIWVHSEPGHGATFHFTVAARLGESPAEPGPLAALPALRGRSVLLWVPGEVTRRVALRCLEAWEVVPWVAQTQAEALEWLRGPNEFALGILGVDSVASLDWVAELRLVRGPRHLPLVAVSPLAAREVVARATRLGIGARLVTPLKPGQLREALMDLVEHRPRGPLVTPPALSAVGAPSALRVLVAEDNLVNQRVALQVLEHLGHRADAAGNGLEALAALEWQTYDLVLLDVHMPELDGLETARCIRRRWTPDAGPRLIAMTASALPGDREACLAAGMDDYLSKPVQPQELRAAIERQFARPDGTTVRTEVRRAPSDPAAAPPAEAPGAPHLDPSALDTLQALDGGEDGGFVRGLVELFLNETPKRLDVLRAAARGGDLRAAERTAHSLKSSAAAVGARRLSADCALIEREGHAGRGERLQELVQIVCEDFAALEPHLRARLP